MATPVLNPLSEARDQTLALMDTGRVCYRGLLLPSQDKSKLSVSPSPLQPLPQPHGSPLYTGSPTRKETGKEGSRPTRCCRSGDAARRGTEVTETRPSPPSKKGLLCEQAGKLMTYGTSFLPNNTRNRDLTKQNTASSVRRSQGCCQSIFFFPRNTSFLRNPEHFQTRRDYSDTFFLNKGQVVFHVLPADPATILGFRRKEVCHSHPADEKTEAEETTSAQVRAQTPGHLFLFVCVCLFSFLATTQHVEFLGQGSDPNGSCNLHWIL